MILQYTNINARFSWSHASVSVYETMPGSPQG